MHRLSMSLYKMLTALSLNRFDSPQEASEAIRRFNGYELSDGTLLTVAAARERDSSGRFQSTSSKAATSGSAHHTWTSSAYRKNRGSVGEGSRLPPGNVSPRTMFPSGSYTFRRPRILSNSRATEGENDACLVEYCETRVQDRDSPPRAADTDNCRDNPDQHTRRYSGFTTPKKSKNTNHRSAQKGDRRTSSGNSAKKQKTPKKSKYVFPLRPQSLWCWFALI